MARTPDSTPRIDSAELLQSARPVDEPARRRWFIPALLVLIGISIPWYRRAGEIGEIVAGLPAWVWLTLACSLGISIVTAVAAVFCWRDGAGD
ncbi:MAG: hypothetical protein WD873_04995 [Candidatus Hydrogenedentales bacterium]